jgi:hypothetical protein
MNVKSTDLIVAAAPAVSRRRITVRYTNPALACSPATDIDAMATFALVGGGGVGPVGELW